LAGNLNVCVPIEDAYYNKVSEVLKSQKAKRADHFLTYSYIFCLEVKELEED